MGKFRDVRRKPWRLRHGTSYPSSSGKDIKIQDLDEFGKPKLYKPKGLVGHGFDFNYNVAAPSEHIVRKDIAKMNVGAKCVHCKKEFNVFTSKDTEKCDDCYDNEPKTYGEEIDGKKYY